MRFKKFAAIILMSTMIGTMSLSGCGGVNKDAVAITMTSDDKDAIEVTMGYANFAARIQQAGYDSVFASYYGDDYWTNDSYAKDGKNMQESIKDSVLESIETQYLLEKHMSDYGVEITEEDQAAIKKAAEQFMSDNSKAALKEVGATQEYVERYLYLQTVEKRMKAAISATADTNVSDEEAAQKKLQYVLFSTKTKGSDGKSTDMSDDEKAEVKKKAEDFQKDAASAEDFSVFATAVGASATDLTFDSDTTSPNEDLIKAADKLKEGEVTDVIEADNGYYVAKVVSLLDRDATDTKKESIVSQRKSDQYQSICKKWKKKTDIKVHKKVWNTISFADQGVTVKSTTEDTDTSSDSSSK